MPASTRNPALAWLVALAFLVACRSADSDLSAVTGERPVRAVSNMLHPPFSYRDGDGMPAGIEVDVVAEGARRLGRSVEWSERPFAELLEAVATGEADVAASTIGITEERARRVTFTRPFFETAVVALVREGAEEPRTLDDLSGRRVGTERGTTAVEATAARIPTAERVLDRIEGETWAEMLGAGRVDAVVLDASHADTFMAGAGVRFHRIEEPLRRELFALAVSRAELELRFVLDAVIAESVGGGSPPTD